MGKGGALRYSSVAAMPHAIRSRVEAQGKAAPRQPETAETSSGSAPRKPRRDSEHIEQVVFFDRIRTLALNHERYALAARRTFAIPNGGGRTKREAGRLKAEGVTAGVSDIFCSVPSRGRHGLYIEMKSLTGYASREQKDWTAESIELGYEAATCRGADAAFQLWKEYVDG